MFRRNLNTFVGFLDQFGGDITFSVQDNQKLYKTMFGTVSSIAIYTLGMIYFFYLSILYLSNQIPPNLTQVSQFIQGKYAYKFQNPTMAFSIIYPGFQPDPSIVYFSSKIYLYHNGDQVVSNLTVKQTGCENLLPSNFVTTGCVDQKMNISLDLSKPGTEYYQVLHIWKCENIFLQKGQRCATDDEHKDLMSKAYFQVIVFLEEFDYKTTAVRNVAKYFYQFLKQDDGYNLRFQVSQVEVDGGWFLQQFSSQTLVTDVEQSTFSFNSTLQNTENTRSPPITRFQLILNPQLKYTSVQYPKVGSLLAQFQSVFSVILLVGVAVQIWAERQGNLMIMKGLIKRTFPSASPDQINVLINGMKLMNNSDPNPLNHFYHQKIIQLKSIEEVLKQLLELRMIVTLLLRPENIDSLSRLGMNYDDYVKYLNGENIKNNNISNLHINHNVDEEKQRNGLQRKLNPVKKKESELTIISKGFTELPLNLEKIQPINFQSQIHDQVSQNYLNKYLMRQFTFMKFPVQHFPENSPDNLVLSNIFENRFESSCE